MNTDKIYAEQLATIFAYSFGVLSALVMGVGMCLCMGQIGPGGAAGDHFPRYSSRQTPASWIRSASSRPT